MIYRALGDLVVLIHVAFVLFVVLGGLLVIRRPRLAWLHVPSAIWGALIEYGGWVCPLTPLENSFRMRGGEAGYSGGFIEHYVVPALYPGGLTRSIQIVLGSAVVILNLTIYATLLAARRVRIPQ